MVTGSGQSTAVTVAVQIDCSGQLHFIDVEISRCIVVGHDDDETVTVVVGVGVTVTGQLLEHMLLHGS